MLTEFFFECEMIDEDGSSKKHKVYIERDIPGVIPDGILVSVGNERVPVSGGHYDPASSRFYAPLSVSHITDDTQVYEMFMAAVRDDGWSLDDALAGSPTSSCGQTLLAHVELPNRVRNALERENVGTIGQVLALSPTKLMQLRNFSRKSMSELASAFKSQGIVIPPTWERYATDSP